MRYAINYTFGETGRLLADQFREHLRDVEKNDKDASKPVACRFNLPNHSTGRPLYVRGNICLYETKRIYEGYE